MGKVVDFLQVLNVLLALLLGMIVDLEWPLRPHEVWVGLRVVAARNLLSIESHAYYGSNIFTITWASGF